jgi:hypothetical protein
MRNIRRSQSTDESQRERHGKELAGSANAREDWRISRVVHALPFFDCFDGLLRGVSAKIQFPVPLATMTMMARLRAVVMIHPTGQGAPVDGHRLIAAPKASARRPQHIDVAELADQNGNAARIPREEIDCIDRRQTYRYQ